ncbi:MAG: DUF4159 domain-containing protein [Alphaproteobacteria bacterium]
MIPLAFANAGMLAALIALPAIWYFLRLTPPRPRLQDFPPTRLLLGIARKEEQPDRSPWWLTALRLTIAALVILALSGPILRPSSEEAPGSGPLLVVIDNGWSSASAWDTIAKTAQRIVRLAEDADRPVALLATAEGPAQALEPTSATAIAAQIEATAPRPWHVDHGPLVAALGATHLKGLYGGAVWLSGGTASGGTAGFARALADVVAGPLIVHLDTASEILALGPPENSAEALAVPLLRADSPAATAGLVRARDIKGRVIGDTPFTFDEARNLSEARFDLPVELRNEIVRLEIVDVETAGGVQLIDDRWRRRRIGLITGASTDIAQPLLSPLYYIARAASPFADITEPREDNAAIAISSLIESGVSMITMADVGTLPGEVEEDVAAWVRDGGTLVRFAGPRLAGDVDRLVPVRLRNGDRILGGSLSWQTPQRLASFADGGPFAGLPVPDDVLVSRQVLAEPDGLLEERTWAALGDGTPLVTAAAMGKGTLVLFHVTADTSWSNLPLSGTFVEMLRRIVTFSANVESLGDGDKDAQPLPPLRLLDGFGRFGGARAEARALIGPPGEVMADATHPPGLYGSEEGFRALNLITEATLPRRLDPGSIDASDIRPYPTATPERLARWLLAAALLLLAIDSIVVFWLSGGLLMRRSAAGAGAIALLALVGDAGHHARADPIGDQVLLQAANETRLAYVLTGDEAIDATSRAGLDGLSRVIAERTALEPGAPMGVDPAVDELAFFPLIYWPVTDQTALPHASTMARVGAYMRRGGSVLFDTRDQLVRTTFGSLRGTPALERLRDMLASLDIPPLEPVPADHVLTKAFYLLNDFPGRYAGGTLWVEALQDEGRDDRPVRAGDGVSTILITSNDFAAAWAVDQTGVFLFPTVPPDRIQREMSLRAGVNIVMYTLTGNYKADQVHVPALLERLGQ